MVHMKSTEITAGIDVGGTKTFICIVDGQGQTLMEQKIRTRVESNPEVFFDWLFEQLQLILTAGNLKLTMLAGIGIGFPGVIGDDVGILWNAPVFNWPERDLRATIRAHFSGTIYLDNDVNMAVLGEQRKGAAIGKSNVIMVAIGTGIGSALILNGRIYSGANHAAGEIGHWIVGETEQGPEQQQQSGNFGPLERVASGTGIAKAARHFFSQGNYRSLILDMVGGQVHLIETEHVLRAAAQGDESARLIMNKPLANMAITIANAVSLLNPDVVVLGGGVVESGTYYIDEIRKRAARLTPLPLTIVPALLGNEAGAYGAVAAVRDKLISLSKP